MPLESWRYYEVDVPIHHTADPTLQGLHVLTGRARSRREAIVCAHRAYEAALAARQAGLNKPDRQVGGWAARGARDGWEPDWMAAKARPWVAPCS
jgi:hypothetical protein